MITKNFIRENLYLDSIILMSLRSTVMQVEGVEEISLVMGSDSNKEILEGAGLLTKEGRTAQPGDLLIAVRVENGQAADRALARCNELLAGRERGKRALEERHPASLEEALHSLPEANLALISLPGPYAAREAEKVLESGRHVMIFSDNVPLDEEIRLKKRAQELGLLVMGPDCGTAIIGGIALGFANRVRRGPFGIVGASGTGIQEVSVLLHRSGYGTSQAIGLGSRDLLKEVRAMSMLQAIEAMERDSETLVVVLISKPPDPEVASLIYDTVRGKKKRYVINFLHGDEEAARERGLHFASGLEEAAQRAIAVLEERPFIFRPFTTDAEEIDERARAKRRKIGGASCVRGLFSGGTLAEEALLILTEKLGGIHSNIPLQSRYRLENSAKSRGNTIVDLGDDEFTRGKPHPMIDYTLRCSRMVEEAGDPSCGVILFDVVLGYGAHPDPSSPLVSAVDRARSRARSADRELCFVASLCGTNEDPQGYDRQRRALEEHGVIVLDSTAQAARFAGLVLKGEGD